MARALSGRRRDLDVAALAAQLGLLPDLRYLIDGLERSLACVRNHGTELEACLRAVPGRRLEPDVLANAMGQILAWSNQQAWSEDDPRRLPMAVVLDPAVSQPLVEPAVPPPLADLPEASASASTRTVQGVRHPLAGYCLSVAFHWSNLFYTLEPAATGASGQDRAAIAYGELMTEFSAYVLAAQSTIDPDTYMAFVAEWWATDRLPARPLYPDRRLASRVATASRAMRRLSRLEHRVLFGRLADRADGSSLPERVDYALDTAQRKDDETLLRAIDRLFESVQLDRRRSGVSEARKRSGKTSSSATRQPVHNKFKDGYLRIAYQPAVLSLDVMEDGLAIETLTPMPPTEETLALDLVEQMPRDDDEDDDAVGPDDAARPDNPAAAGGAVAKQSRRARAREEAKIQLDGQEWFPVQEGSGDGGLVALHIDDLVEDDGTPTASTTSNRHMAEHVRRHHLAHGLSRDRLLLQDARALLAGLREQSTAEQTREVCVGLAASLALGRPLEEVARLQIHEGRAHTGLTPERIHYCLAPGEWVLPTPPPAWADMAETDAERVQWSRLFLFDRTGFGALLAHCGLNREGEILKVLTTERLKAARRIVATTLPRADATPAQCAAFLFHRLLATSRGDLGMARQITGKEHSHAASVHHYAHYPVARIWRAYHDAWDPDWTPSAARRVPSEAAGSLKGVGAKRVPTVDAVKRLLEGLRGLMDSGPSAQRHNAFTAYTQAGLVLGTGMRPVVEPVIGDIAELRGQRLIITYLDKARTDYHRRINAIPPALEKHLAHYADHLRALRRTPLLSTREPLSFVRIDPDTGEPARFQPMHFKALVSEFFPLEPYALRRFVRTQLRMAYDVPGEDIDAFMGHWLHPLSPHDRLSTYPMRRLRQLADGSVQAMLAEVGFVPCKPGS